MGATGRLLNEAVQLPGRVISQGFLILVFVAIGLALVALRFLFMEFAPWGAKHAKLTAFFVNFLMDTIWIIFETIKLSIQIIIDIVRVVLHKHAKNLKIDDPPKQVSSSEIEHFLRRIPVLCHDFTWTNAALVQYPLRHLLSPLVCPVLRYLWPLPWAYEIAESVLLWFSFDPTPVTGGGNCEAEDDTAWICVGFGAGYLILEIFVPFLIFILIAFPVIIALLGEGFFLSEKAFEFFSFAKRRAFVIIDRLGLFVEEFISVN